MYSILSLFPDLFIFSFLAPTILRVGVGIIILSIGLSHKNESSKESELSINKVFSYIEIVGSILLIIGLYTQASTIILSILMIGTLFSNWKEAVSSERNLKLIIVFVLISITISGPGAFAFDLPF